MFTRCARRATRRCSVQTETPSRAMSLIRKPPFSDKAGNPPWDATNTPGVVNMKLIVE